MFLGKIRPQCGQLTIFRLISSSPAKLALGEKKEESIYEETDL
jgi:hypothetical protein